MIVWDVFGGVCVAIVLVMTAVGLCGCRKGKKKRAGDDNSALDERDGNVLILDPKPDVEKGDAIEGDVEPSTKTAVEAVVDQEFEQVVDETKSLALQSIIGRVGDSSCQTLASRQGEQELRSEEDAKSLAMQSIGYRKVPERPVMMVTAKKRSSKWGAGDDSFTDQYGTFNLTRPLGTNPFWTFPTRPAPGTERSNSEESTARIFDLPENDVVFLTAGRESAPVSNQMSQTVRVDS